MNKFLTCFLIAFGVAMISAVVGGITAMSKTNSKEITYRSATRMSSQPALTEQIVEEDKMFRAVFNVASNDAIEPLAEQLEGLRFDVTVKVVPNSSVLELVVMGPDPDLCAALANDTAIQLKEQAEKIDLFKHAFTIVESAVPNNNHYNSGSPKALIWGGFGAGLVGFFVSFGFVWIIKSRGENA
jgi:hypothetical protein